MSASFPCFRHLPSTDSQIYDFTLHCRVLDALHEEKGEVMAGADIGAGGAGRGGESLETVWVLQLSQTCFSLFSFP